MAVHVKLVPAVYFRRFLAWSLLVVIVIHTGSVRSRTLKDNVERLHAPLDYAVLGQQKSGTSSLWMQFKSHPDIACVGSRKETLWFNGDVRRSTLCDNDLSDYQRSVEYARVSRNRPRLLVGDWSATHLSCLCCPLVFKTMNPNMKLVVVLRDPVQRALSRFMEQKVLTFGPCHKEVQNETFGSYVTKEMNQLQRCREGAARYGTQQVQAAGGADQQQQQQQRPATGWGAGMDLGAWMTAQCAAKSNILGWSLYDVFFENYLAHFPQEQLLVLYTDELSTAPLAVVRRVEAFLGLDPGNYSAEALGLVYNSRGCYSWECAKRKAEVRSLTSTGMGEDGGAVPPPPPQMQMQAQQSQQQQQQQQLDEPPADGPFAQAVAQLVDLYRPHMQRMFAWADAGRIAPPPEAWRSQYELSRT